MRQRQWTIMVVPHGTGAPREIPISERLLRALLPVGAALGLVVLVGIGTAIAGIGRLGSPLAAAEESQLQAELEDLRGRLRSLQDTIAQIGERDEKLRLLAGLPPIDDQVRQAGTGGPGSLDLSHDPLYRTRPTLGRLAFGTRSDIDALIRRANVLAASFAEVTDSLAAHQERLQSTPSIMPTAGWLSSQFSRSRYHPILHRARPHEGIDLAAPMGAPIVAPAKGRVSRVAREAGYGLVVEIDHGNGIVTKYAHCSRILVRQGEHVTRGQTIARVGNSGLSTGPHLHYEIHVHGKVVDPLTYVLPEAIPD